MNLDSRQTLLIQTPVGKGLAPWQNGEQPNGAGSPDESARKIVTAPPQSIKGTAPVGDTHAAPVAKVQGAKLPGLSQLKELSAEGNAVSKPPKWRDNLIVPEPPPSNVGKIAVGISGGVVAGVLACVLAMNYIRNSTAERLPQPIPPVPELPQAVTPTDAKTPNTDQEKSAGETHASSGNVPVGEGRSESPRVSTPAARLKSRLSPEVLFRLELSLEQADRIRRILDRNRKNLPAAEEQIRELLTAEQDRQWESIAP
ncbi:MAG: hypothetical protein K8R36_20750 [Planctomycetales bacterium]|nr:hypothetical protein [Planctomycetales bacterium]